MRLIRHTPDKYFISYGRISHIYSFKLTDTLARKIKSFVAYLFKFQATESIVDKFIRITGHFVT